MPTLKIIRISEYTNRLRKIKIFIDNVQVDTIANGETKDFQIKAGTHELQAKIDWCSSPKITFTIAEDQSKAFDLSSFARHNSLGAFAAIYYITFGARKYLDLIERIN